MVQLIARARSVLLCVYGIQNCNMIQLAKDGSLMGMQRQSNPKVEQYLHTWHVFLLK